MSSIKNAFLAILTNFQYIYFQIPLNGHFWIFEISWKLTVQQTIQKLLKKCFKQNPWNLPVEKFLGEGFQEFCLISKSSTFVDFLREAVWTVPKMESKNRAEVKLLAPGVH